MSHVLLVFFATHSDLHDSLLREITLLKKHRWVNTHLLLCSESTHIYYYDPVHHRSHTTRAAQPVGLENWFQIAARWMETLVSSSSSSSDKKEKAGKKVTFLFSGHSNGYYIRPTETVYHSVADVRKMIQNAFGKGFRFETMIFDSCAMASLEALYEFRECTKLLMAAEGYLDDNGFLSPSLLHRIDRLADDDQHTEKKKMLTDLGKMYKHFPDQWNASLLCTDRVDDLVRVLSMVPVTENIPFVYPGYHLVDLYAWMRDKNVRDWMRHTVLISFAQNGNDMNHNHGLSITPGTTRWNGFADLYAETSLWKDSARVRGWHSKWDVDMRVMSVNLQFCDTVEAVEEWKGYWHETEADLICVQEIGKRCVTHLEKDPSIYVVHHDEQRGTAVLWLHQASDLEIPLPRSVWVRSIHLNDVPSIPHHRHRLPYEGNPPFETELEHLLVLAQSTRGSELEPVLAEAARAEAARAGSFTHFILAGDFNEPSHLDLQSERIAYPISKRMEEDGWVDVMHLANCAKPTWPSKGYFAHHPPQRIDFVYLKGGWRVTYADRYVPKTPGWMSDHYALICDLTIKK